MPDILSDGNPSRHSRTLCSQTTHNGDYSECEASYQPTKSHVSKLNCRTLKLVRIVTHLERTFVGVRGAGEIDPTQPTWSSIDVWSFIDHILNTKQASEYLVCTGVHTYMKSWHHQVPSSVVVTSPYRGYVMFAATRLPRLTRQDQKSR
jgi:hypothetical protein